MVGGPYIGVEEEFTGIGIWPVFWDCELGFAGLGGFYEFLEGAVFADKSKSGGWANFGNGVEIIASEKYTEVNKLCVSSANGFIGTG
jgi:hypothetical protein